MGNRYPLAQLVGDLRQICAARTSDREIIGRVRPLARRAALSKDLWIEDRNFCTTDFLLGVARRGAYFAIRRHGNLTVEPQGEFGKEFEAGPGWVKTYAAGRGLVTTPARVIAKIATHRTGYDSS